MAAAYDHSDHNAPAIRHCDVIAYRSFISCSCVRIRSGVPHVGLPWLRPTQVQSWNFRVDDVIRGRRRLFPTRDVIDIQDSGTSDGLTMLCLKLINGNARS
ncbi:hypothetical protein ALC60_07460 [Trachymyrmex zeteki]|uniref:Uncharacterized protein n=1 Tax=Mycetomoellerius zeteki TaxID=64791 RepID=A0A151WZT9_9HYME|nr:hypothetical protein ALC60_07460 [Trachymyrmex zeteki]